MVSALMLGLMIVLRGFPATATARWLIRQLDATREAFARVKRRHLVFAILLGIVVLVGAEWLAMAGPADMALVLLWDVSSYVDLVLATATIATVARARGALRGFALRRPGRGARRRTPRIRPASRHDGRPANDDDERPRWRPGAPRATFAAAA